MNLIAYAKRIRDLLSIYSLSLSIISLSFSDNTLKGSEWSLIISDINIHFTDSDLEKMLREHLSREFLEFLFFYRTLTSEPDTIRRHGQFNARAYVRSRVHVAYVRSSLTTSVDERTNVRPDDEEDNVRSAGNRRRAIA